MKYSHQMAILSRPVEGGLTLLAPLAARQYESMGPSDWEAQMRGTADSNDLRSRVVAEVTDVVAQTQTCGSANLILARQAARSLMSDSAGIPRPSCNRQIILSVSGRLRLSTSCTRFRLPMKGMRSRG